MAQLARASLALAFVLLVGAISATVGLNLHAMAAETFGGTTTGTAPGQGGVVRGSCGDALYSPESRPDEARNAVEPDNAGAHRVFLPLVATSDEVQVFYEDFEGRFPGPWRVSDASGPFAGEYFWSRVICRSWSGSYSAWAVGGGADGADLACGNTYPDLADSWLKYGPFSLADARGARLSFKVWLNSEPGDALCWGASADDVVFHGQCSAGNSVGWVDVVFDFANTKELDAVIGQGNVWVALAFQSDGAGSRPNGVYVDDVALVKFTGDRVARKTSSPVLAGLQVEANHFAATGPER